METIEEYSWEHFLHENPGTTRDDEALYQAWLHELYLEYTADSQLDSWLNDQTGE